MYSEEDLEKYTKQLNVEKEILLNQIKSLSEELSAKKAIIVKCFQLFENYTNILIKVNTICKCNAINNQLSVICVNNERKCLFDNNCQQIDGLITDSENVIQKFETNNNEMNDKHLFSYYSKELKAKQTTNDGKPDLMSSDDSEDSNTCIESDLDPESDEREDFSSRSIGITIKNEIIDDIQENNEEVLENNTSLINEIYYEFNEQTLNSVKTNNNNEFNESVQLLDEIPNNEICMKAIELKKLDLTENKGKDYVDEILQTQDFLKCPQDFNQINDQSEKPLIIGNFKSKTKEEKLKIRKTFIQNKYLVKKFSGSLISLSVPQIDNEEWNPIRNLVFIGIECPYKGCDYRSLGKIRVKEHINDKHLNINPFNCLICGKGFPFKYKLNKHKYSVHSNKQLKCDFNGCEFVAKHTKSLKSHQKCFHSTRIREKLYVCDWNECESKFISHWNLKRHIDSVHKNIKQYDCHWPGCDAKFVSNSLLTEHILRHTCDKPYSCDWPDCHKKFKVKQTLKVHKQTHEDGKQPFVKV